MKNLIVQTSCSRLCALVLFAVFAAAQIAPAASVTWNGGGADNYWTTAANWGGTAPVAGDTLIFAGTSRTSPFNSFVPDTAFDGIIFDAYSSSFTLGGNDIVLSGAAAGNTFGVFNNYGLPETVNLNMQLDWGYYVFGGGGGVALNGALSPVRIYQNNGSYLPVGGVAYFAPSGITSSSFTPDPNSLISGLGGAGLIATGPLGGTYNNLVLLPLATISGGAVGPLPVGTYLSYSAATLDISGSPTTANVRLTAAPGSGTTTPYIDSGISVNTITIDQNPGNTAGTAVVQLTTTGTLTLGGQGGIYVTGPGAGAKQIFKLAGGNLTAMPNGLVSGMIVFGINGDNAGNQLQLDSIIEDNPAFSSPVTLVKTGPGSMVLTRANTYSGGTYVDQGFLEDFTANGLGSGPVYVASGAEVFLQTAGGTWANNFYISPGAGPSYSTDGAIKIGNGNRLMTLSGTLNLLGNPGVPGDRAGMSGNGGIAFLNGQITGTGTLELTAEAVNAMFGIENIDFAHPNNWTGGLLIDNAGNDVSWVRTYADGQLGGNNVTLSASGTGVARLDLSGFSQTIGGLSAAANPNNQVTTDGQAATLTLGAGDATASFGGVISDSGSPNTLSIVKIGAGTQTLSGANTYSGATTVQAGTLIKTTASSGNGSYTVESGATLDIQVASVGGYLSMSSLTLQPGCTLQVDTGSLGNPSAGPIYANALTGSGTVNIQLSGTALASGTFVLVGYGYPSAFAGTFNLITTPPLTATLSDNGMGLISVTIMGTGGPTIVQQPTDQTVCAAGGTATFTVSASGTFPITYQWQVSTDGGNTWANDVDPTDSGVNSTTLTVNNPDTNPTKNGYQYRVLVSNAGGTTPSSVATLTVDPVAPPPDISAASSVCANSTGNTANGPPLAPSYLWTITGGTITGPNDQYSVTYTAGASGSVVLNLTAGYVSGYCPGQNSVTIPINPVAPPPDISAASSVCANSTGNTASGPPLAPSYLWTITGGTITGPNDQYSVTYTAGASGSVVLNLTAGYVSGYCPGQNSVTIPIKPLAPPPNIIHQPTDQTACAGSQATFIVDVDLTGQPTAQWQVSADNGATWNNLAGQNLPSLLFTADSSQNGNLYQVLLTTCGGTTTSDAASLTVNSPPVAKADLLGTVAGTSLTAPAASFLVNDSSPIGGALSIVGVSSPSTRGGTVGLAGGTLSYVPPPGAFTGQDQFSYTLSDGRCTSVGNVTVTVTPPETPPFNNLACSLIGTCRVVYYTGNPGQQYVVQSASAPGGPWADLSPVLTADATGQVFYSDCTPPAQQAEFYSLRPGP